MLRKGDRIPASTSWISYHTLQVTGKTYYATTCPNEAGGPILAQVCTVRPLPGDAGYEVLDTIYLGRPTAYTHTLEIIRHIPIEEAATLISDPWPLIRHGALKRFWEGR